jgi:hypothetical protein
MTKSPTEKNQNEGPPEAKF